MALNKWKTVALDKAWFEERWKNQLKAGIWTKEKTHTTESGGKTITN
jgi:hypothetical protein